MMGAGVPGGAFGARGSVIASLRRASWGAGRFLGRVEVSGARGGVSGARCRRDFLCAGLSSRRLGINAVIDKFISQLFLKCKC